MYFISGSDEMILLFQDDFFSVPIKESPSKNEKKKRAFSHDDDFV